MDCEDLRFALPSCPDAFGTLHPMSGLNKVMLIGNLGKAPELRWLESGQAMCTLSIATSERYRDKSGQSHERTEWHKVVMWRELAEIADRHLTKGQKVYIEGRLRTRSWQDGQGTEHRSTEIVADRMEMLSPKGFSAEDARSPVPQESAAKGPHPMDPSALPF